MKTILIPAAALGCATLLGLSAHAIAVPAFDAEAPIEMAGSSDGAGLPGFPGGRAGKSGRELAREQNRRPSRYSGADDDTDPRLVDYCVGVLQSDGRSRGRGDFRPSDCAEYFMALDSAQGSRRTGDAGRRGGDGEDGPSIAGGQGGQGGRSGGGPGGGRGGGGGAGVSGGTGGKGGAGGGGY